MVMPDAGFGHGTVMRLPRTIGPEGSAMFGTGTGLVIAGVACLIATAVAFYKIMPRDGEPPSQWAGTDTRGTAVALGLMVLMLTGVSLVIKGFTA